MLAAEITSRFVEPCLGTISRLERDVDDQSRFRKVLEVDLAIELCLLRPNGNVGVDERFVDELERTHDGVLDHAGCLTLPVHRELVPLGVVVKHDEGEKEGFEWIERRLTTTARAIVEYRFHLGVERAEFMRIEVGHGLEGLLS